MLDADGRARGLPGPRRCESGPDGLRAVGPARRSDGEIGREAAAVPLGARAAAAAAAVVSRTASSSASIVVVVSRAPSSSASASGRSPPASARRGVFALAPRSVIALSLLGSPRCASSDSEDTTDARARFLVTVAVRRVSFASLAAGAPRRVADMSARRSIPS